MMEKEPKYVLTCIFGHPDYLVVQQGMAHTLNEMKHSLETVIVRLDEAPEKTTGAIGALERYHAPLRIGKKRIWEDTASDKSAQDC